MYIIALFVTSVSDWLISDSAICIHLSIKLRSGSHACLSPDSNVYSGETNIIERYNACAFSCVCMSDWKEADFKAPAQLSHHPKLRTTCALRNLHFMFYSRNSRPTVKIVVSINR